MKKITIFIKDHALLFKYRTNKPVEPNLLNTNVISNNELVFSQEYLQKNLKIVGLFIYDLAKERDINEIVVSNNELGELVIDIIKRLAVIECFTINDDVNLSYALCEKISKVKNIKKINCYGIPQFMIEKLDKHGIKVDSRNEVLFTSNFMAENNLTSFSKIYYKNNINISEVLLDEDFEDINTFFIINKYLKVIHVDKYSLKNIKKIIDILKDNKRRNIVIQIHDDLDDSEDVLQLKNLNKELKNSFKIKIVLIYSKDYLEKNYLQQIVLTTLKICALIIFVIVFSIFGYVLYNNHQSEIKINNIKSDLNKLMIEDNISENDNISEDNLEDKKIINSYNKLLEVNPDMVGWLTVKGTNIDYPVVQTSNNNYYLTRNFYKEDDYNGWVFIDYRNNIESLDSNTIFYAHNRFTSGVMFGSLPKIRKKEWYSNKENHILTFNTLYKNYNWKIFSYYGIDITSDYLFTQFENDEHYQEFLDMLIKRSEHDFKTKVTSKDKIITLSTCLENDQRFVVHAVLVENIN